MAASVADAAYIAALNERIRTLEAELAEARGEGVVGYAVVARDEAQDGHWTFVEGRYGCLEDAQVDARAMTGQAMRCRVAKLVLLPEEE